MTVGRTFALETICKTNTMNLAMNKAKPEPIKDTFEQIVSLNSSGQFSRLYPAHLTNIFFVFIVTFRSDTSV